MPNDLPSASVRPCIRPPTPPAFSGLTRTVTSSPSCNDSLSKPLATISRVLPPSMRHSSEPPLAVITSSVTLRCGLRQTNFLTVPVTTCVLVLSKATAEWWANDNCAIPIPSVMMDSIAVNFILRIAVVLLNLALYYPSSPGVRAFAASRISCITGLSSTSGDSSFTDLIYA